MNKPDIYIILAWFSTKVKKKKKKKKNGGSVPVGRFLKYVTLFCNLVSGNLVVYLTPCKVLIFLVACFSFSLFKAQSFLIIISFYFLVVARTTFHVCEKVRKLVYSDLIP